MQLLAAAGLLTKGIVILLVAVFAFGGIIIWRVEKIGRELKRQREGCRGGIGKV